jgi:hypothetical protein
MIPANQSYFYVINLCYNFRLKHLIGLFPDSLIVVAPCGFQSCFSSEQLSHISRRRLSWLNISLRRVAFHVLRGKKEEEIFKELVWVVLPWGGCGP